MLNFVYAPIFIRQLNKLDKNLQEEAIEKLAFFEDIKNHKQLKVHKLKGKMKDVYSFSVNYKYRIVFSYSTNNSVSILSIGDHDIYN
jgi:plasmid maintenance system killer protein